MVAKLFTAPFAKAGDKTPIPDQQQLDGTVSYETGFGADYERQLGVDPAAKNIGRLTFNELQFDITTALQELQAGAGTSAFNLLLAQSLPGAGYPKGAVIPRLDGLGLWVNTVVANTTNPDTGGAGWIPINPAGSDFAVDTGIVNVYVAAFSPAITTRTQDRFLCVKIKTTNTGAATFNDGLGAVPLLGPGQQPIQSGELLANGLALVVWNATLSSYVLAFSSGGQLQVLAGKSSLHAVNVLQIQNQSLAYFATTGTNIAQVLTPAPAIAAYVTGQRFSVAFNVDSGANPTINVSARGAKLLKQYTPTGTKVAAVFVTGQITDVVYDGVDMVLLNPLSTIGQATEASLGGAKVATQAQTNTGTDDATIVTPKKLKAGFSILLAANGYVIFPTWLGGFVIQWARGIVQTVAAGGIVNQDVSFPIPFPNSVLFGVVGTQYSSGATSVYMESAAGPALDKLNVTLVNPVSTASGAAAPRLLFIGT